LASPLQFYAGVTKYGFRCGFLYGDAAEPESLMNFVLTPDRRGESVTVAFSPMQ
jgi:hypothetical protein